ncbi:hypothetical protein A0U91_15620 (plasmid) [Acetobacter persici]|uniref:Helicase ATP-binding domain-containing protein n=1 Tax=Acetobacter persici TaxID=1076596 RepID=A0A1U9LJ37_9PROT|nr:hypothetical protein A0U91_15620 [Acetobacter persici]
MLPRSIASELYEALSELKRRVGDVDSWMSDRLQWAPEKLYRVLSAEQIDTAALAILAADDAAEAKARGEEPNAGGVIVASMTGFGKGRVLAATCLAAVLRGRNVVFMTLQENLFSDFWRDIRGIESEELFGRPLLINEGATIVDVEDPDTPVLVEPYSKKSVTQCVRDKRLPDGCRLVMLTHSQVNRPGIPRAAFLEAISENAHLALDEAHKAAGESNTRYNIDLARSRAASTTESSATFAADISNLGAYTSVMPWLANIPGTANLPRHIQIALSQASVKEASTAGGIIRHELDMDGIQTKIIRPSDEIIERNERVSDELAPILSRLAIMARQVSGIIASYNLENKELLKSIADKDRKQHNKFKETWTTSPFGSRLSSFQNQILTALNVDLCASVTLESLRNGQKPIAVIEATMESIMNQLRAGEIVGENDDVLDPDPPTIKAALFRFVDAVSTVLHKYTPDGETERVSEHVDLRKEYDGLQKQSDEVKALVSQIRDMPLYPIDQIREIVEAHKNAEGQNYVVGEVSGRSLRINGGKYEKNLINRNQTVARLNNGGVDAAIFTKAASTGLSAHDKFQKSAQAHMVWVSLIGDIREKRQMEGRVNRRGQRTKPLFSVLDTGLPYNTFVLTNGDRKENKLDANLTGAETSGVSTGMTDPIDLIGEDVAREFLNLNRHIATEMGISLNITVANSDKELYFVNKLFRRLPLVSVSKARSIITAFFAGYEDRLKYSINPNLVRSLEGQWKPVKRFILQPGNGSDDPLKGPDVTVTVISKTVTKKPLRSDVVGKIVRDSRQRLRKTYDPKPYLETLETRREMILTRAMDGEVHKTLRAALCERHENHVQVMQRRLNQAVRFLQDIVPGCGVMLPDDMGAMQPHIILDIKYPEVNRVNVLRDYHVTALLPGASEPTIVSLEAILRYSGARFLNETDTRSSLLNLCNEAPHGEVEIFRTIIDGNLMNGILDAHHLGLGEAGTWKDIHSRMNMSIIVPKPAEVRIAHTPVRIPSPVVALELLRRQAEIIVAESLDPKCDALKIRRVGNSDSVAVVLPEKEKSLPAYFSPVFQDLLLTPATTEEYQKKYPQKFVSETGFVAGDTRTIDSKDLPRLITSLQCDKNLVFYTKPELRESVVSLTRDWRAKMAFQSAMRHTPEANLDSVPQEIYPEFVPEAR